MESMEYSRKKRIVPLSTDLLRDIMTHKNEYQTPSGSYKEVKQVGDTRGASRSGATHSPQFLPPDTRRRTDGFADGPIVVNPPVTIAFLPRSKSKKDKQKPIVKQQKEGVKESLVELWVRDPPAERVAQKIRRSFDPDKGSSEKLTPSLTKMETRLDSLENEVHELRKLVPIPTSSVRNKKPIGGGPHFLNRSQSTLSLGFRSSCDLRRTHSSSELYLRDEQSLEECNTKRQLYCDMQMHLVNMIVVPKSRTSLFLNQQKELNCQLGGCLGHWRHQYSDEDWLRDFEAAVFLNRNSVEAKRRSKNVRRQ
ncbi:uncharacterized protein LOC120458529 [Drosophila santomea]|uniref:uncharacterized protein LOC120458529 n=1 Tax=Drosophila santomea TaxID=129105 RepID=UPI0019548048|nr:uncharacterized protein LOC120458529 [Drosophila santomea]